MKFGRCIESYVVQGAHAREKSGKTGNFVKKNSLQGKIGEFGKMGKIREKSGNFTKTCQGNIREFSACFIILKKSQK